MIYVKLICLISLTTGFSWVVREQMQLDMQALQAMRRWSW